MRDIKFRGLSIKTNKWLIGDLVHVNNQVYIFPHGALDSCDNYEVYPSTVGQYTGLKDAYNIEIYEKDIIISKGQDCEYIQIVEFHNTSATCGRGWVGVNVIKQDIINGKLIKTHIGERFSYFSLPCNCKIIGNIHNNPDLLIIKTEER